LVQTQVKDSGKELFEALGISEVLWIDDFFYSKDSAVESEELSRRLIEEANNRIDSEDSESLVKCGLLPEGMLRKPAPIKKRIVRDKLGAGEVHLATAAAELLGEEVEVADGSGATNPADTGELNHGQFTATVELLSELADDFKSFSFTKWHEDKDTLSVGENTLVFVDLRSNEPGFAGEIGVRVIEHYAKKLKGKNLPVFVVLTFECDEADEENKRSEIFSSIDFENLTSDFFQVMAKSRLSNNENIDLQLVLNIKRLLLRKVSFSISGLLFDDVVSAISDVKENILSQDIYAISNSLFLASNKEGVSEIEAFSRLFSISQRLAVYQALGKSHSLVSKIRTLRRINSSVSDGDQTSEPNDFFGELRRSEVFIAGKDINAIFDPLSPGDIFTFTYKTTGSKPKIKEKSFILITQPCDMVLRSKNGRRKTNVGVLVPLHEYDLSKADIEDKKSNPAFHEVFTDKARNKIMFAALNSDFHVNLNVLDWCSFSHDGSVLFCSDNKRPDLVHLEGHVKRFDELLRLARQFKDDGASSFPQIFSLDRPVFEEESDQYVLPNEVDKKVDENYVVFSIPMKRVKRLSGLHFEHLLRSYFSYRSRQAFDHEFV